MPDYTINPIEHNLGGSNAPYEKYHLMASEHTVATRLATASREGLMPYGLFGTLELVGVPTHMTDPGSIGQRAQDEYYIYFYTTDGWRRAEAETF